MKMRLCAQKVFFFPFLSVQKLIYTSGCVLRWSPGRSRPQIPHQTAEYVVALPLGKHKLRGKQFRSAYNSSAIVSTMHQASRKRPKGLELCRMPSGLPERMRRRRQERTFDRYMPMARNSSSQPVLKRPRPSTPSSGNSFRCHHPIGHLDVRPAAR